MAYAIDADTFVQAKNFYYAFDICPAFWTWVDREAEAESVLCIRSVYDEVASYGDDLSAWIKVRGKHKWLHKIDDVETQKALKRVAAHVESRRGIVVDAAISKFMAGADPWIIAYSLAHEHTVVTREVSAPASKTSIKIPDVCDALGVTHADTFKMMRALKARFVL